MHVDAIRLTPDNLPLCGPLWGGRQTYVEGELSEVLAGAAQLLSQDRALGAIVVEDGRPRAFSITTFADEVFVARYLDDVHPHIGKRLLLDALDPASTSVLHVHQIAERNAEGGLQVVVANSAFDAAAREPDVVLGRLITAFHDTHRGYRIARIIDEAFGAVPMSVVAGLGGCEVLQVFDLPVPGGTLGSLVATMTREQAAASRNPLLAVFAYSPPRLFFTAAEKELIAEALDGATDDITRRRLGIPLSAVKARWSRIQERVARVAPELLEGVPAMPHRRGRGVQTRHLILQYVRDHPSELTPYPGPRLLSRRRRLRAG
jgi:hypothetical protein